MIGTPRCTRQARRGCETSEAQATVSVVPESSTERAHLFSLSSNDAPRTFLHFAPEITNLPTRSDPKGCRQEYCSVSQRDFQKNIGVILAGRRARWTRGLRTGQAPVPCAAPPRQLTARQESPLRMGKALKTHGGRSLKRSENIQGGLCPSSERRQGRYLNLSREVVAALPP